MLCVLCQCTYSGCFQASWTTVVTSVHYEEVLAFHFIVTTFFPSNVFVIQSWNEAEAGLTLYGCGQYFSLSGTSLRATWCDCLRQRGTWAGAEEAQGGGCCQCPRGADKHHKALRWWSECECWSHTLTKAGALSHKSTHTTFSTQVLQVPATHTHTAQAANINYTDIKQAAF